MRGSLSLLVLVLLLGPSQADAEKVVREQLAKHKAEGGQVSAIKDEAVVRTFPNHDVVSVLFPQFPVGRAVPEPLRPSSLYFVTKDGKPTLISDGKELHRFFESQRVDEKEAALKDLVRAWLLLAAQLRQDGFYRFKIEEDSIKVGQGKASGKIIIADGGNGQIEASLVVRDGKVTKIDDQVSIRAGIRPRCQATLLLHPERLVRELAEQDLLVMGRSARGYLQEQRAKASPELQRAIDRIWQRIERGER